MHGFASVILLLRLAWQPSNLFLGNITWLNEAASAYRPIPTDGLGFQISAIVTRCKTQFKTILCPLSLSVRNLLSSLLGQPGSFVGVANA